MVLGGKPPGRVGRRRDFSDAPAAHLGAAAGAFTRPVGTLRAWMKAGPAGRRARSRAGARPHPASAGPRAAPVARRTTSTRAAAPPPRPDGPRGRIEPRVAADRWKGRSRGTE